MTFKNGAKGYIITGVLYGIPMGLIFGIMSLNVIVGIVSGILAGTLFAFLIFLFSKFMENKFAKMRAEIAANRKVICDGAATVNGNGGWLFLTEHGLEFYPHKINVSTKEMRIPFSMIQSVDANKNLLIVTLKDGQKIKMIVIKNTEWKKQIEAVMTYFCN
ncbi:MAG: hypothetical protein IJE40_03295 [Clostridia bacterium]|nr:hypothetical protein [Clostridia bacterium]